MFLLPGWSYSSFSLFALDGMTLIRLTWGMKGGFFYGAGSGAYRALSLGVLVP